MAKECGAERTKYGVRSVCVRPVGHHGDHTSHAGIRWAGEKPSKLATWEDISANNAVADRAAKKSTPPLATGAPEDPEIARLRKIVDSMAARKTPEPLTMDDVIANIKDRLSVDVRVSRTGYEDSSNTVRVTLMWDNVAFSETSDTIPTE